MHIRVKAKDIDRAWEIIRAEPFCKSNEHADRIHRTGHRNGSDMVFEVVLDRASVSTIRQALSLASAGAHAAKSIAMTSLGIGRATDEQVDARLSICRNCPGGHAVFRDRKLHTCGPMVSSVLQAGGGPCGCVLSKKARDLAENCPFGWWPKQGIAGQPNSDEI